MFEKRLAEIFRKARNKAPLPSIIQRMLDEQTAFAVNFGECEKAGYWLMTWPGWTNLARVARLPGWLGWAPRGFAGRLKPFWLKPFRLESKYGGNRAQLSPLSFYFP